MPYGFIILSKDTLTGGLNHQSAYLRTTGWPPKPQPSQQHLEWINGFSFMTTDMLPSMCKTQLLSSLPVPPRIIGQKEEEVSVIKDHMVSLLCDVQAYPPPEITWTRDGQLLHFSTGIHILPGQTSATHNTQIISVRGHFLCLTLITAQMLHYVLFYTLYYRWPDAAVASGETGRRRAICMHSH